VLLATRAFLFLNGQVLEPKEEDEVLTMVGVADGSIDESALSTWLSERHENAALTLACSHIWFAGAQLMKQKQ
jgi:prophage maintenance system killer protein